MALSLQNFDGGQKLAGIKKYESAV